MRALTSSAVLLLLLAGVGGCGDEEADPPAKEPPATADATATAAKDREPPQQAEIPAIECPAGVAGCRTAGGEIIYVERVDPDGDGDAHFVLVSRDAITAPGISVIDVRADLRPEPLPGPGDLLAAAGPVYRGSYGQRQIQAEAISFERVR